MPLTNSAPALTRPDGSPLRVLVVDDEVNIAELISMAVRFEGWEPSIAHTGSKAVAVGEADGARAGLAALAEVDPALPRHRAASAYLLEKAGDLAAAARTYAEAADLATSQAERTHLTKQAARLNAALR